MTKKALALVSILLVVLVVVGCAPAQEKSSTEAVVGEDIDEVTAVESDLDTSSMDNLDQDLKDITW